MTWQSSSWENKQLQRIFTDFDSLTFRHQVMAELSPCPIEFEAEVLLP